MTRKPRPAAHVDLLRRAERRVRAKSSPVLPEILSPEEAAALVHELRVHQVELELQNDELRRVQAALKSSWDGLAESERRYRELYEAAPVGYLTLDADGRIRAANAVAAALLRAPVNALVGRRFSDFVAPERQDAWHRYRRALARGVLAGSRPLDLRAADGEAASVELGVSPMRDAGHLVGLHLALLDVTERRRAERELHESERRVRLITDALPVLVSFVDREERYRFVNAAYETWFGRPAAALRGCTVREVLGDAAYAFVASHVGGALAGVASRFEGELPYQTAGTRFVDVTYSPDVQEDGTVRGFYTTVLDLTALRRTEQALRAAAAETALAEQQERRKLAADLHDDVAQILSLASMKLRALEDAADPRAREELLGELAALVTAARRHVSSLSFQLSPPVLHDVGLVAAAEWLAEDLKGSYGLEVRLSAQAELDELDDATRVTLFRALRELLINVARHAGCREAHVRIARDEAVAEVEAEDRGVGFDPAAESGGFGLRSLCDRVEHMGGSVRIDSAPGRGTKVVVRAPFQGNGVRGSGEPGREMADGDPRTPGR